MAIKHVKGDIFESGADVILHQVNCKGVMGSGVAKQVKEKYPDVYLEYLRWCRNPTMKEKLLGQVQILDIGDSKLIVNMFAQDGFGWDERCYTNYDALKSYLKQVNTHFASRTVAIPYKMSCDRGGGDWSIVSKMIEETLTDCDVTLYEYRKN